jgi:hypothetical protein
VKIVMSILGLMALVLCFAVRTSAGPTGFRFDISRPSNFSSCDFSGKMCAAPDTGFWTIGQGLGNFAIVGTLSQGSWDEPVSRKFYPDLRAERLGGPENDLEFFHGPKSPTPEPGTLFLIGTGLVGFAAILRRRLTR